MTVEALTGQVEERMEVVCSKGGYVGRVAQVEADRIRLTGCPNGAQDRWVPWSAVAMVDTRVHLLKTSEELGNVV